MQVVEPGSSFAWYEADQQRERLDMMLVGDQQPGTWVLASMARRAVLSDEEAAGPARRGRWPRASSDGRIDDFRRPGRPQPSYPLIFCPPLRKGSMNS
jgi:hypothetical protein